MDLIVLDASAGAELLLNTHTGRALRAQIPAHSQVWVPEHFLVEVASVLRRAELRLPHQSAKILRALERLIDGDYHRVQVRPLTRKAWAKRGHLTIADALYVVLAEELGAILVTADHKLARSPGLAVPKITP